VNIGFVTTRLFGAPRNGGEICSARLLDELLNDGHRVQLIGRGPLPDAARPGVQAQSIGPAVPPFDTLPRAKQAAALLAAVATAQASTVQRLAAGGASAGARRALAAAHLQGSDLLVLDHLQTWRWVQALRPRPAATLVMMHNLESDGYAEQARAAKAAGQRLRAFVLQREACLLRRLELHMLQHASAVACLSEADAAALRTRAQACGARPVVEVLPGFPLAVDVRRQPAVNPSSPPGPRRIGLLGTWTWAPNRAGLGWLLEEVLPRLPRQCELVLAGTGLEEVALPDRARWLGRVADTRSFYGQVDVVAVPSFSGSGVQEKAIEAVGAARAVVATSHALRGLMPGLPPHVHVADEAAGFARLCAQAAPTAEPAHAAAVERWAAQRRQLYRQALQRCLAAA